MNRLTLLLALVSPAASQVPVKAPAAPRVDSIQAAWTPSAIEAPPPATHYVSESPATIRFHNGVRFQSGVYQARFLGLLPSTSIPYVVLSGRGCTDCDANIAIYVLSPVGPPVNEATTRRFWYPGHETDMQGQPVRSSRAFIGRCLPHSDEALIWYDSVYIEGQWHESLTYLHVAGDSVSFELRPVPALKSTLQFVGHGSCREIAGIEQTSEP